MNDQTTAFQLFSFTFVFSFTIFTCKHCDFIDADVIYTERIMYRYVVHKESIFNRFNIKILQCKIQSNFVQDRSSNYSRKSAATAQRTRLQRPNSTPEAKAAAD